MVFAVGLILFFGCSKDSDGNPLAQYFTVEGSTFQSGALPSGTEDALATLEMNGSAIPGGSSMLTVTNDDPIAEFYLTVDGVDGYFAVPATLETRAGGNTYKVLLLISQSLNKSFTFKISGKNSNGGILSPTSRNIAYVPVGNGALQVSLSFNNNKDVDLYVVRPNGEVIYYSNRGGYNDDGSKWGLDLDSNPSCNIDGVNNENIYFPASQMLNGKYEVWVNMYANCNPSIATTWVITATRLGTPITPSFGQNPATGVFPVNTPSNGIEDNLSENASCHKVMEFTVTGGVNTVTSYTPLIQLPSAIEKMRMAGIE